MWRYVVSATLARTADEGARVGLVLLAVDRTGSTAIGGVLVAALLVPQVVAAPVVGLAVDRSRRPPWILAALVAGFSMFLGLGSALVGHASAVLAVTVLVAAGTMAPAVTGALTSQLGVLAGPERLTRAFGIDSAVYNVCGVAGPAAAAFLATAIGGGSAMGALATAGLLGSLFLMGLRMRNRTRPAVEVRGGDSGPWAGVAALIRDGELAAVTTASCLAQVGLGALGVVVAVLASRQESPSVAAWLFAALPIGALLGSVAWTRRPARPDRAPRVVMWGLGALGLAVTLAGIVPTLAAATGLLVVSGLALGPATGALFLTRERRSPSAAVAQVFAVGAGLKLACSAAGAVLAGLVAEQDPQLLLIGCGAFSLSAGLLGAVMLASGRRRERVAR